MNCQPLRGPLGELPGGLASEGGGGYPLRRAPPKKKEERKESGGLCARALYVLSRACSLEGADLYLVCSLRVPFC